MHVDDLKKAVPLHQKLSKLEYLFNLMQRTEDADIGSVIVTIDRTQITFTPKEVRDMIEGPMQGLYEDLAALGVEQ